MHVVGHDDVSVNGHFSSVAFSESVFEKLSDGRIFQYATAVAIVEPLLELHFIQLIIGPGIFIAPRLRMLF
mgnify:CR=1 FL=1